MLPVPIIVHPGIKHLMTTTYHSQTSNQMESFQLAVVAALRHYLTEDQNRWDQ